MKSRGFLFAAAFALCFMHTTFAQGPKVFSIKGKVPTYGCLSGENPNSSGNVEEKTVTVSSGNALTDKLLLEDISELNNQFGVYIPVYFWHTSQKNAFFTNLKFDALIKEDLGIADPGLDGSVFITTGLWQNEVAYNDGFALPTVIAHEFAHAMQHKNKSALSGKWLELHADYLAGWFTGHRYRTKPFINRYGQFDSTAVIKIQRSLFDKGDQGYYSKDPHGTPGERANAFKFGYELNMLFGESSGVRAYVRGIEYLQNCQKAGLCI